MEEKLKYTNNLKSIKKQNEIAEHICSQIKTDFPNSQIVCLNVELIRLITNEIEFLVETKKLKRVNKKDLFFDIYLKLFDIDTLIKNKEYLNNVIDFLHDNNLIVSVSLIARGLYKLAKLFLGRK